jgi:signal transduction histidine kinase
MLQVAVDTVMMSGSDASAQLTSLVEARFRQVTQVVDDLVELARFSTGQLELARGTVDLGALVGEALEACRELLDSRAHEVALTIDAADGLVVLGDAARLRQALTNLIDNAARYSGTRGRIEISARAVGSDVVVEVSDNGRGIAPTLLPRIFDMFVRERTGSDGAGGLGLGLAFVKQLVEHHDGTVVAHSDGPGRGARFELRIPLAPQDVVLRTTLQMEALDAEANLSGPLALELVAYDD